ncbi:MAG: PadR family transcriptional regulator [Bacteroides sp.]
MKDENNAKGAMQRSVIELCTLAIIAKHDAYTNDIIQLLRDKDIIVVEGSLYPLLSSLKNRGMLSYRLEESDKGPARKYYNLTSDGERYFHQLCKEWEQLVSSVDFLILQTTHTDETNNAKEE